VSVRRATPILNVSDVRASIAWFGQLGWKPRFVWDESHGAGEPGFAGIGSGSAEIFLCRDAQGSRESRPSRYPFDGATGGVWMSWFLDNAEDVDAMHARALELGLDVTMAPTDEPWGVREFHLRDPNGHTFRVGAATSE